MRTQHHRFKTVSIAIDRLVLVFIDWVYRLIRKKKVSIVIVLMMTSSLARAQWTEVEKVVAEQRKSLERFGNAVAVSGDYAAVGVTKSDTVFVYKRDQGTSANWNLLKKIYPSDATFNGEDFGQSVAMEGDYIVVGASRVSVPGQQRVGAAYIYEKNQGGTDNWGEVKKLVASDRAFDDKFGISVSISGHYIIVGAPQEDPAIGGGSEISAAGSAYIFKKDQGGTNNWGQVKKIFATDGATDDFFGWSVSISGEYTIVGAYRHDASVINEGAAYIFKKDQGGTDNWGQLKKLDPSNLAQRNEFGSSVSISGGYAVVGSPFHALDANGQNAKASAGIVYVFQDDQGGTDNWGELTKIAASDRQSMDNFGTSVSVSGVSVIVGSPSQDDDENGSNHLGGAGAAYLFLKDQGGTNAWGQTDKIVASDRSGGSTFGNAVAVSGSHAVVGAPNEADNSGASPKADAGSAYIFEGKQTQTINFTVISSKTYGDAPFTLSATASSGLAVSFESSDPSLASVSGNQVTIHQAGTVEITAVQAGNNNYFGVQVSQQLIIDKAALLVNIDGKTRVYGESNPVFTFTYTGFLGSDNASSLTTEPAPVTTATSLSNVGIYAIVGAGGVSDNYDFNYLDGLLFINKAMLMVTASDQTKSYGDTNPALTLDYSGFVGTDDETVLDTAPSANTTADETSPIGTYSINVGGAVDNNYDFQYANGTLTVDKATLTVTADDKSKTYGGVNPDLTTTFHGFVNGEDETVLTRVPIPGTTAGVASAAGDYAITLSSTGAENYDIAYVPGTLSILKATLTITPDDQSKTYGETNPTFTLSYSGFVNGEDAAALTDEPTAISEADETSGVGDYVISASGGEADNYDFAYEDGLLTIGKSMLAVTADDQDKTYGEANPTLTITYSGFVGSDDASVLDTLPTATTTADETSTSGSYSISAEGGMDDNYDFTYTDGTLNIDKAILTAIADDQTKTYGAENPALTLTYTGFVNGEDDRVLSMAPTTSTLADETSVLGDYTITVDGGAADNYVFVYTSGTLTIDPAELTITADNQSKTYGDINPTFTVSYVGFVNGEDANSLTAPTASTWADEGSGVGSFPITLSGGSAENYSLKLVDGTLTIEPAILSVMADDQNRIYGETNPEFTISYEGFVNEEDATVLTVKPQATTVADESSTAGQYAITVAGGESDNYTFNYTHGTLTVGKAGQNITFGELDQRTFGDPDFELTASASSGLTVSYISSDETVATVDGNTLTVLGAGTTTIIASQAGDDNYEVAVERNQLLTINKADQVIAFDVLSNKLESDPDFDLTAVATSGLPVTYISADEMVATVSGHTVTIVGTGTTTITASQVGNDNYQAAAEVAQDLTVEAVRQDQTISFEVLDTKIYGEASFDLTAKASSGLTVSYASSDEKVVTVTGSTVTIVGAGTTTITASQMGNDHFEPAVQSMQDLTIEPASLVATANDQMKIYGMANPELTFSYTGFVNDDDHTALTTEPTVNTEATASSGTGTYAITLTGGSSPNYSIVTMDATLTIMKADLTVTADDQLMKEGDPIPTLTFTYTGFLNGDDESVIDVTPAITTLATAESASGEYAITLSGGEDNNYQLILEEGVLTVDVALSLDLTEDPFLMYPNPTDDWLMIEISGNKMGVRVEIYHSDGRLVVAEDLSATDNRLDLRSLDQGMYMIRLVQGNQISTRRLIKGN